MMLFSNPFYHFQSQCNFFLFKKCLIHIFAIWKKISNFNQKIIKITQYFKQLKLYWHHLFLNSLKYSTAECSPFTALKYFRENKINVWNKEQVILENKTKYVHKLKFRKKSTLFLKRNSIENYRYKNCAEIEFDDFLKKMYERPLSNTQSMITL